MTFPPSYLFELNGLGHLVIGPIQFILGRSPVQNAIEKGCQKLTHR
jgi:hypothetical protein